MPKFHIEDKVKIVNANNLLFGNTGSITAIYDSDLMPGEIHYRVTLALQCCLRNRTCQDPPVYGTSMLLPVILREFELGLTES